MRLKPFQMEELRSLIIWTGQSFVNQTTLMYEWKYLSQDQA
jgi:hypothetical protein